MQAGAGTREQTGEMFEGVGKHIRLACYVSTLDWRGHHRTMKATGLEDNSEARI
jgi:hypothetical protein